MSKLKKWIITVIAIIVILIIVLLYVLYQNRGKIIYNIDESGSEIQYDIDETIKPVTVRNDFYVVKNCVNEFYSYCMAIFNADENYPNADRDMLQKAQNQNAEVIYDILDSQYINYKNITKENISSKLEEIKMSAVNITDMYISEKTNNISIYIVKGTLRENKTQKISNFTIIIKTDMQNRTFSIIPNDYVEEKYKNIEVGNKIEIDISEIKQNINNKYTLKPISDETYLTDLINQYKQEVLYNSTLVYNKLDNEYKDKRFSTFNKFQEYINNNKSEVLKLRIEKYKKTKFDDYTKYMCIGNDGNYYIFKETSVMKYTLLLDTYTIDLPEFIEKYDAGNNKTKVELNIGKFIEALNNSDYDYIYKHLDEQFKSNNFKTINEFENYIKLNFYNKNSINLQEYEEQNDIYIYDLTLKNVENELQSKSLRVVVKLLENRNFVMSFSM